MVVEDATLLLPLSAPITEILKQSSVWKLGRLTFRSDFDSGNLQDVKPGNSSTVRLSRGGGLEFDVLHPFKFWHAPMIS